MMTMKAMAMSNKPKTANTNWYMSPYASWFFLNYNWSTQCKNTVIFASINDSMNPSAFVSQVTTLIFQYFATLFLDVFNLFAFSQAFRLHLIENALQALVKPGCQLISLDGDQVLRKTKIPDVLSYVQLIMENSILYDLETHKSSVKVIGFEDQVAYWWSCVIAVAAYWILGDDVQAEQLYSTVEQVPERIAHDPLVRAIFAAFQCRKTVSLKTENYDVKYVLASCDNVGTLLQESISVVECLQSDHKSVVSNSQF